MRDRFLAAAVAGLAHRFCLDVASSWRSNLLQRLACMAVKMVDIEPLKNGGIMV